MSADDWLSEWLRESPATSDECIMGWPAQTTHTTHQKERERKRELLSYQNHFHHHHKMYIFTITTKTTMSSPTQHNTNTRWSSPILPSPILDPRRLLSLRGSSAEAGVRSLVLVSVPISSEGRSRGGILSSPETKNNIIKKEIEKKTHTHTYIHTYTHTHVHTQESRCLSQELLHDGIE